MADSIIIDADEAYEGLRQGEVEGKEGETSSNAAGTAEESAGDEGVEIEVEGKKPSIEAETSEVGGLKAQIQELQQELLHMSSRMQAAQQVQAAPKEAPKEEQLSRAQLAQIIAENQDKPEVLLNVIDYMAEQKTKSVKEQAFKELSESNWTREIAGNANQVLAEDRDGYIAANPQVKDKISQVMKNMRWEGHPAGALAAYGLIRLSESLSAPKGEEEAEKAVVAAKTSAKMDKTRSLSAAAKSGSNKLTKEHLEMAKRLGIKDPNLMARFIP